LLKELAIVDNAPYLVTLGHLNGYGEFAGSFDDLCRIIREIHEALTAPVIEPEPAPEPDPAAVAAQITVDDTKNLLNTQTGSSTRKPPEPVIDEPGAAALAAGEVAPGVSPFDTGKPQVNPHTGAVETPHNGSAFNRTQDNYMATVEARRVAAINAQLDQMAAIAEAND
jgi:hypothetical protein